MYRTFARPNFYGPDYNSDVRYPVTDEGVTDAQFKSKADLKEGINGQAMMQTHYDNTETDSNALAPKSELYGGFDLSEKPVEGNAGDAKHWIRR